MLKKLLFLSLLLEVQTAFGQTGITVKLPDSGDFAVFTSHGLPTEVPQNPTVSKGGPVSITSAAGDDTVSVWDKTSGNLGSKAISKLKGIWNVSPADLDHIAQIKIHVVHDGNPVASGEVSIDGFPKREPEILDSKSGGDAQFFDVKSGRMLATVKVKGEKGGVNSVAQVLQFPLVRDSVIPTQPIAIAATVDTVVPVQNSPVPSSAPAPSSSAPKPEAPPNPLGTLFGYVVGFAIVGGAFYGAYLYFKKQPGTVAQKLEQLGVQIPKPDDPSLLGPVSPISLPKPEPPQKILLDDAVPTPLTPPLYTPPSVSVAIQEPSLLSSAGIPIPLVEGETVVGRDPGLGLSLTGESTVSRKHANVLRQGSVVTVNDLGSTNGTFVNGARLQSPVILRPGDSVQFGSVAFKYQG